MDIALELPSQAPTEQETWEVFRDAFAPPQDTRRPRPWERSSVPAHAPRLQGQKIWKKAGIQIRNNKENEATLLELQSEGNGSRKKRKMHAAKQSIQDALWKSTTSATEPLVNQDNKNTKNGDTAVLGGEEDETLRFVPRKRTNTDHVITPRKPLRQTQLIAQPQPLLVAPNEDLDNITTRRRKSMRRSSIRKSTSTRTSARFSSGSGPAWLPEEYVNAATPVQQLTNTASQFTFGSETPIVDSHPAQHETKLYAQPAAKATPNGARSESDSQGPLAVHEVEGPKARKRSSIHRDSKRGPRSSSSLASINEDLPVQMERVADNTASVIISSRDISDYSVNAATTPDIITEEAPKSTPICVVHEISEPEVPNELVAHRLPLADDLGQSLSAIVPSLESISSPPQAHRESSPGSPSEQLHREVSQGQNQSALPATVEVPKESSIPLRGEAHGGNAQSVEDTSSLDSITVVAETSLPTESANAAPAQPTADTSSTAYEDDTDMLRKFLTRVKANKAAKAENATPKRKRSLPHSPLRLPLGDIDANSSPSPLSLKPKEDPTAAFPSPSPKRRKRNDSAADKGEDGEPKTIRRSGRTRLPVKTVPGAPSLIPVRRLGPEGDSTVTIRRSEEKDIAALTRVNTRKNKGPLGPTEVLLLKAAEKTDPVLKQRLLKEMFEEKQNKEKKKEKHKSVSWAKELAQFQCERKDRLGQEKRGPVAAKKTSAVRAGPAKNKIALTGAVNGTPAPKRRVRERP